MEKPEQIFWPTKYLDDFSIESTVFFINTLIALICILHTYIINISNIYYICENERVSQLCLTFCDPMDCSPPGFSVPGILQARIQEWIAIPFSRGSSQTRDLS